MERFVKAGWHGMLVAASIIEWRLAQTQLKKHLALACAGWHVSAMIVDMMPDKEEYGKSEGKES